MYHMTLQDLFPTTNISVWACFAKGLMSKYNLGGKVIIIDITRLQFISFFIE